MSNNPVSAKERINGRQDGFVAPASLSSGTQVAESELDSRVRKVAFDFQRVGVDAAFSEMQSVVNGIEQNRATELVGRIAAAGEQLALAGAAFRDVRAWQLRGDQNAAVAGRALAEIVGYFSYGAAHGLINATARLFAMENRSRESFIKQGRGSSSNEGFPPFGTKPGHWISFNSRSINSVRDATRHHLEAAGLIEALSTLDADPAWAAMVDRRHNDFHRWRPQTTSAGVAPVSQWRDAGEGVQSLVVYESNVYSPETSETFAREASLGLESLTKAMEAWIGLYPTASHQVQIFTLAAKYGEEL